MTNEEKVNEVQDVFIQKKAKYKQDDVFMAVAIVDKWNKKGYKVGYREAANFLFNKRNIELVITQGLTKTIKAMSLMNLGPVRKGTVIPRNSKCPCGTELKYKNCCINKK